MKEERNKYIQSYEAKWIFVGSSEAGKEDCDVGDDWRGKKGSL